MRLFTTALLALAFTGTASGTMAQTVDPDRTRQQEALAHAVAIQNAWASVETRIRVTDVANLWDDEWDGRSAPPSGSWWLASWAERGLTARYCDGVLAVYAATDELKGLGRGHREVQVAPVLHGGGRTGLHVILKNTRMARGAHGREDTALPACMQVPSTGEDRVGLVGAVADPVGTVTGIRWETEFRTENCPGSTTDTYREARQVPIQVTAITNCAAATPECNDLSETAPSASHLWPRDCSLRPGLGDPAQCGPWRHASGLCPFQYAQAAPPTPIPDPVINCSSAPVDKTTAPCSCPSGETGTCTLHYEQDTWNRNFQVRPGAPVVTTRRFECVDSSGAAFGPSTKQLMRREEDCEPIPDSGPDGESGDDGSTDSSEEGVAEDDSANEGFGGSSMGPPGSDGTSTGGDDGSCFLTTAVIQKRGEADDGRTLTALREFRDGYMLATPEGRRLVADYYWTAPGIVAAIPRGHSDWEWIAGRIDEAVEAIGAGEDERALSIYTGMVRRLADKWL